jgi:thiamine biosynthesis lipoprotein
MQRVGWGCRDGAWLASLFALLAIVPLLGCGELSGTLPQASDQLFEISGRTMGTTYSVKLVASETVAEQLRTAVDNRLVEINKLMSTYDPESELSRFNASGSTDIFRISDETAKVVSAALQLADDSGGAFDPTVGPLVDLWGFGPAEKRKRPPTDDELAAAKNLVGYKKILLDAAAPAVSTSTKGVRLDLSAIAKGYGVDAVAELVEAAGVSSYMVEIGGEVRMLGTKPGNKPWQLGIEKPDETGRSVAQVLKLTGGAVATSGDYRNFFEYEGQRYSHTIDPSSGRPVTHALATASVYASDCMSADGIATTLLVLGPQSGYDWAEKRGIAALLIERLDNRLRWHATTAWKDKFGEPQF